MALNMKLLLNPWASVFSIIAGIITGVYFKAAVPYLKPLGEIYLSILQMCVIPIMASAVVISIGKLVKTQDSNKYLLKMIGVFVLLFLFVSFISIAIGMSSRSFINTDTETKKAIGKIMLGSSENSEEMASESVIKEIDSRRPERAVEKENNILDFLMNIIPKNIFTSLAEGENLKIIFFCIVLGIMLKFVSDQNSDAIMIVLEGVYLAFLKLISIAMYFLPFALFSLISVQFSGAGLIMLASFAKLIIIIYAVSFVVFFVSSIIIWKYTGGSYFRQFKALGDAIMICLGARNSLAAIPSIITGLSVELGLNKDRVNLSIPLGIALCRYGVTMLFTVATIFAAQLYGYSFNLESILILVITSIMAAVTTSGAPFLVAMSMISIILAPLGLPSAAIIVILIAIDPVVDPVATLLNVYPNCAVTAIIAGENKASGLSESGDGSLTHFPVSP